MKKLQYMKPYLEISELDTQQLIATSAKIYGMEDGGDLFGTQPARGYSNIQNMEEEDEEDY